ncbi:hypothetical protein DPEC_G00142470, partial [Dallia pectoralis]
MSKLGEKILDGMFDRVKLGVKKRMHLNRQRWLAISPYRIPETAGHISISYSRGGWAYLHIVFQRWLAISLYCIPETAGHISIS